MIEGWPGKPYILTPEGKAAYLRWLANTRAASADTLPKGGDAKQAPCASKGSAVGNAETPETPHGIR